MNLILITCTWLLTLEGFYQVHLAPYDQHTQRLGEASSSYGTLLSGSLSLDASIAVNEKRIGWKSIRWECTCVKQPRSSRAFTLITYEKHLDSRPM